MTTRELRELRELRQNGFSIFPVGRKVCFLDQRNGYCSPSFDPDTCQEKLAEYMGLHRVVEHIELRSDTP